MMKGLLDIRRYLVIMIDLIAAANHTVDAARGIDKEGKKNNWGFGRKNKENGTTCNRY
ncbi:hypothetical protein DNHGIG_33030 [Collibacillus ludicampi]|uniref:Uncharacterized protein n=1 Tax=Collibacillus ludicampi TaxID=2771369 RepID=A0AAV4LK17_9BACL|nr:hypothetical protein [Collibacillus ludicampi]GIM47754.1 hypothetical protein DNHGIG_33030 [Collibacillus ludicampi]